MKVVTICGSMKFAKEMQKIATELETKNGWCVIQCVYDIDKTKITDEELQKVVNAHWKKIDISDAIYVVDINGYIGQATENEIEYAKKHNKEIFYHSKKLKYSLKIYFKDNTTKITKGKSSTSENIKYDFDGICSWEEYYDFTDKARTEKEVANKAKELYNIAYDNQIIKVEIINIYTGEVVVSSD